MAALHRAAYLLYTHRFPLEGQGMLVLGPNRLFLTYIEQVLPSLGEAGVEVSMLADLLPGIRVKGLDDPRVSRIKGDLRMISVLRRARRDRQRPLRADLTVGLGLRRLRLTVDQSAEIVTQARRRFRTHNRARRFVEEQVYQRLADSATRTDTPGPDAEVVREQLRGSPELREALEWMWPVLTPAHFLHDLLGSPALLRSAARVGADPRRGRPAPPAPSRPCLRGGVDRRRRPPCSMSRWPCSAPDPATAEPTRSAPTATSWWTRPKTCRPCNSG